MTSILRKVLSSDPQISRRTDSYIDDIAVNEAVVSSSEVCKHLRKSGLEPRDADADVDAVDVALLAGIGRGRG